MCINVSSSWHEAFLDGAQPARGRDWVSAALAKEALAWRLRPERIGRLPKEKPPIHADERLVFRKRTNQFGGATRSRTGLDGFAIRCITALLSRRVSAFAGKPENPMGFQATAKPRIVAGFQAISRIRLRLHELAFTPFQIGPSHPNRAALHASHRPLSVKAVRHTRPQPFFGIRQ